MSDYDDTTPVIEGQPAGDRLMERVRQRTNGRDLLREEVAAVLYALSDYWAMEQAVHWREDFNDAALSVCRWLDDTAWGLDEVM